MSVPPDYFSINNPLYSPEMGLAMGLLQAGAPSRLPVGLGQALGQGIQGAQQNQAMGLEQAMQGINYQRAKTQLDFLQGMGGSQMPQDLQGQYQYFLRGAQAGLPGYADLASQIRSQMMNTVRTLDPSNPEDLKLMGGTAPLPGEIYQYNDFTHKLDKQGESVIKTVPDPVTGQPTLWNASTNKPVLQGTFRQPGQALPGPYEKMAQEVANYDVKPPNAGSGRGATFATNILTRAQEINPDFNAQNYDVSLKAAKDFSTGKQGQGVKSFNVALSHLDTLGSLSDALQNGNVPLLNKAANAWKVQTGNAAPTSFNAAKQIVGDEIVKAIVGSGGGVHDRETAAATVNAASSPAQLKQVINTYKQLMVGQLEGLQKQYETTTFRKDFNKYLSPQAQEVMSTMASQPTVSNSSNNDPLGIR